MTKFFMLFLQKKCKLGNFYKKNRPEERFFLSKRMRELLFHCLDDNNAIGKGFLYG